VCRNLYPALTRTAANSLKRALKGVQGGLTLRHRTVDREIPMILHARRSKIR
jgi:hypothetical protein